MLTLLLCSLALADRVYWISPPDPGSRAAVARTLPGAADAPVEALVTGGAPLDAGTAADALRRELAEVRPLFEVFDGELQMMARLQKATADVHRLRDDADRALLWEALVVEGLAVHRYFQGKLGAEAAAGPYRVGEGADAKVAAWMDAAALISTSSPDAKLLPDASERHAYDDVQALSRSMPGARIVLGDLAIGATVHVDGQAVEARPGHRIGVVPGRHFLEVRVGDTVLMATDARLKPGSDALVTAPFGPAELAVLRALTATAGDGWEVPPAVLVPVSGPGDPVYVAVPDGDDTRLLRLDSGVATRVPIARVARTNDGVTAHLAAGAGWLSSGDFLLLNGADGAPETRNTVNAGAPAFGADVQWRKGLFQGGVGVDIAYAVGTWHSLPTGETSTRTFVYPHAAVGLPWLKVTAGPLFPWYVGLGARASVPVAGPLELFATGLWGIGIEQDRGDDPAFTPLPAFAAWGGARVQVGR